MRRSSFYKAFYLRWVAANTLAEAVGLGLSAAIGYWLFQSASPWLLFFGMVLLGICLEGLLVGWLQWRVLHTRLAALQRRAWMSATAIGAGIAWLLGMLPSTLIEMSTSAETSTSEPRAWIIYSLAAAMGLVLGPILAVAQWVVLRRFVAAAGWWIPANAAAWAIGMVIIFATASLAADGAIAPVIRVLLAIGGLGTAGFAVGAIHGAALIQILYRDPIGIALAGPSHK